MALVGGDGDAGDEPALPEILIVDLGHGDVEFYAQAIFEAFYKVPFILERVRVVEAELEGDDADRRHGGLD